MRGMTDKKLTANNLLEIAIEAGKHILEIYENPNTEEWNIQFKADESPLSKADQLAAHYINTKLKEIEPNILIINEETETIPYEKRKNIQRFCLVDPLDGTKEFIKRNGEFTVNIALFDQGSPFMSVVHAPALDETYVAEKGNGAYLHQTQKKLTASHYTPQEKGLKIVASRSHLNPETKDFIDDFQTPELLSMGSSLKFMLVAAGCAHVYPRLAPTMEWDTAAAQLIVEEAGGTVLEYPSQTPLRYNKETLKNPWFIVKGRESKT